MFELCQGSPGAGSAQQRLFRSTAQGANPLLVSSGGQGLDSQVLTAAGRTDVVE